MACVRPVCRHLFSFVGLIYRWPGSSVRFGALRKSLFIIVVLVVVVVVVVIFVSGCPFADVRFLHVFNQKRRSVNLRQQHPKQGREPPQELNRLIVSPCVYLRKYFGRGS